MLCVSSYLPPLARLQEAGLRASITPSSRYSLGLQAMLQGAGFLFCSPKCEAEYIIVAGGSALRRSLRDLERGVCQLCKLDCLQLVKRLRFGPG